MNELIVNVSLIEEWQMLNNTMELDNFFAKAQSAVVQGETVLVQRENPDGTYYAVQEISTIEELNLYRENVYKYL